MQSLIFAVSFYSVVLAFHIMAVVVTFGLPLTYPILLPYVRRAHPDSLATVHDVQLRLNQRIVGPGLGVVLVLGAILASKEDLWSEVWVTVPLVILFAIGGIGGAIITPSLRRLTGLAKSGGGPDYEAVYQRYIKAE
jgi:uncharacterized membrane protein